MRDFLIRFRPLRPLPTPTATPPTRNPIGVTFKAISSVSVIETRPSVNIRIKDETFIAISILDWFSNGASALLRAFEFSNPIVDVVCHPHPALAAGFIFEITPLTNPSQLYSVDFPTYASHAEGIVIHTDLKEIFRRVDTFRIEFCTIQNCILTERERFQLESLPTIHRAQSLALSALIQSRAPRTSSIIRPTEQSVQNNTLQPVIEESENGVAQSTESRDQEAPRCDFC